MMPYYRHDCPSCEYLFTGNALSAGRPVDYYICDSPRHGQVMVAQVVARVGRDPDQSFAVPRDSHEDPVVDAIYRAREFVPARGRREYHRGARGAVAAWRTS